LAPALRDLIEEQYLVTGLGRASSNPPGDRVRSAQNRSVA
jgi:hypothetical protein